MSRIPYRLVGYALMRPGGHVYYHDTVKWFTPDNSPQEIADAIHDKEVDEPGWYIAVWLDRDARAGEAAGVEPDAQSKPEPDPCNVR